MTVGGGACIDGEWGSYRKLTQPVPGGGAIHTKLKMEEGWWLTWEATTLQTNWVPPNCRSGITPERAGRGEGVSSQRTAAFIRSILQFSEDACARQGHLNGPFTQNPHDRIPLFWLIKIALGGQSLTLSKEFIQICRKKVKKKVWLKSLL